MKLAVSNIAWKNNDFGKFLELLSSQNCVGVEIAPSKIWNDISNLKSEEKKIFSSEIKNHNLDFLGFHSLLYKKDDLQLFKTKESRDKTKKYLLNLIQLCSELGGKQLVFGSPQNRSTFNNQKVKEISTKFFNDIGDYSKKYGVNFCLEPLDKSMTDFLTSINETGAFIKKINHPNLKLHIDTKSFLLSKENIERNISEFKLFIYHVHISNKDLSQLTNDINIHRTVAKSLKQINYDNFLSLEMRRVENDEIDSIKKSIKFIKDNYLDIL